MGRKLLMKELSPSWGGKDKYKMIAEKHFLVTKFVYFYKCSWREQRTVPVPDMAHGLKHQVSYTLVLYFIDTIPDAS